MHKERMDTTTIRDRTSYYQPFDEDALIRALMQGRGCLDESGAS